VLLLSAPAPSPTPLTLERTIELPDVKGRIDHMSVDPTTRRLYVAALGNDTVEVVDLAAGRRLHTIRGLAEPQGVLVVPGANHLLVANGRDGTLRIFDASSLAPVKTVPLGDDADNVRLDPESGRAWVGYGAGALREIDPKDGGLGREVALGAHPESFQLERNGARAFVNLPNAREIAVVDRKRGSVTSRWKTADATANFPMALDEGGKRLFVVCRTPPRLLVLSSESGTVLAELPTVGDSDDVFYDQAARRIYVTGGEGAVVTYRQRDADHYEEIARQRTLRGARTSFFSPELRRLFVAVRQHDQKPAAIWVYAVSR
jgi:DNA-binding beta-propeller fold protein YncE